MAKSHDDMSLRTSKGRYGNIIEGRGATLSIQLVLAKGLHSQPDWRVMNCLTLSSLMTILLKEKTETKDNTD